MSVVVWRCDYCGQRSDIQGERHACLINGEHCICEDCVAVAVEIIKKHHDQYDAKQKAEE